MNGVHLVYQYFHVQPSPSWSHDRIKQRQAEYDHCLIANLCHDHILGVHILFESESELQTTRAMLQQLEQQQRPWLSLLPKFHHTVLGRRMRYSDAMQYANDRLRDKIVVILNADIYLGQLGLDQLLDSKQHRGLLEPKANAPTTVLSLTRHEHGICSHRTYEDQGNIEISHNQTSSKGQLDLEQEWCGCPFLKDGKYYGSHDSFWFVPPLDDGVVERCRHVQNRWGAEHKVINELIRAGYNVSNPALTIHTYHHHATDIHPWRREPGGQDVLADPRDHPPLPPTKLCGFVGEKASTSD